MRTFNARRASPTSPLRSKFGSKSEGSEADRITAGMHRIKGRDLVSYLSRDADADAAADADADVHARLELVAAGVRPRQPGTRKALRL